MAANLHKTRNNPRAPGPEAPAPTPIQIPRMGHFDDMLCVNASPQPIVWGRFGLLRLDGTPLWMVEPITVDPYSVRSLLFDKDVHAAAIELSLAASGDPGAFNLVGYPIPNPKQMCICRVVAGIAATKEGDLWRPFCTLAMLTEDQKQDTYLDYHVVPQHLLV